MIWWYWSSSWSAWTYMSTTYKKQKLVTSQHDWYDFLPTVTRRPSIWTCTSSYVSDMEKYSQFPVFEMWPVVETCWEAAQTWTNLYRRYHLQVSWWRVPYNTDRIRPVRRRRHRRPRRRPILPVQSYLQHKSDVTAYRQETIREVGMDQTGNI